MFLVNLISPSTVNPDPRTDPFFLEVDILEGDYSKERLANVMWVLGKVFTLSSSHVCLNIADTLLSLAIYAADLLCSNYQKMRLGVHYWFLQCERKSRL